MSIYLGNTEIGQIYLGNTEIAEAYLGDIKVYSEGVTPPPAEYWTSWSVYVSKAGATRSICSSVAIFDEMLINGDSVTPITSKTWDDAGTYLIEAKYKAGENTVPSNQYNAAHYRSCTLPSNITSIGSAAFRNFASSTNTWLICNAITPPTISGNPFENSSNIKIYVPDDSVDAYKTAWAVVADKIYALSTKQ